MKKIILLALVCALNLLFFQNFTAVSEEERSEWGSSISEADNSAYSDFQSALKKANNEVSEERNFLAEEFVERDEKDLEEDQEYGSLLEN